MSKHKIITILSISLTVIFVAIGIYFIKKHQQEYNQEASYQLSKVNNLLQEKNIQGALNQAKFVANNYKKSPMSKLAMSYEIGISMLYNMPVNDVVLAQDIASKANTLPVKFLYEERAAYGLFEQKKYQQAISILNTIPNNAFNKASALFLEAECYEKINDRQKAISLYDEIIKAFPKTYYSNVSQLELSMINS